MTTPQWVKQVLQANESRCLDNEQDRRAVEAALTVGVEHEREQVVEQIAAWLDQCSASAQSKTVQAFYARLAGRVRRGEWS